MLGGIGGGEQQSNDQKISSFEQQLIDNLKPLLEKEIKLRIDKETLKLKKQLEKEECQYTLLSEKYEALVIEMNRSRELFERKTKEWQVWKQKVSERASLKTILDDTTQDATEEATLLTTTARTINVASPVGIELALNSGLLTIVNPQDAPTTSEDSSLFELADLADSNNKEEKFDLMMNEDPKAVEMDPLIITSNELRKNESEPKYLENLRSKVARKQAHAKDCSCCSKFYTVAGIEDDRQQHIKNVSRHRYKEEMQCTPPGFWDVNFTPRQ